MELKTTKELALELRKSPETLALWRKEGRGPAFLKLGGSVLYEDKAVRDWKDKCRRGGA